MPRTLFLYRSCAIKKWFVIYFLTAMASFGAVAAPDNADAILYMTGEIQQASCVPDFQMSLDGDRPVKLPAISSSNFNKNSLSAISFFSLKVNLESDENAAATGCTRVNLLNAIQFDSTPNSTSVLGSMKNQADGNAAKNINVELILFSSDWSRQYIVDLQNKEPIDFKKIPGWETDKAENKIRQLNFGVRYSKDATTNEEVLPGRFYVVLPFMLKFN